MMQATRPLLFPALLVITASAFGATRASAEAIDAERLAKDARGSIVAITVEGRDGKRHGMGSGFVISPDGMIATNMHVIGEARPIRVQFADGESFDVSSVHASDRTLDLAVLKIEADDLPVLKLRSDEAAKQGEPIVALGNPQGLKFSVVSGVVSGTREVEQREMIQLALPVEPGNSGGPVVDADGNVVGIVTMKSLVTENLGFAATAAELQSLIDRPNPVPMKRWLTIGSLDERRWTVLFGAKWRQSAGQLHVSGAGEGFGGRSLCLVNADAPKLPYEVGVNVRLDDESGAAGLVFHSDGADKHYGFYPSAGKVRLSRFDGPNVFSWKVLNEVSTPHYRPGEWNHLKVRVEKDKVLCYLNDQLVIESTDRSLTSGQIGLAKFRQTQAKFKGFRTGQRLPNSQLPQHIVDRISAQIEKLPDLEKSSPELLVDLLEKPQASTTVLRQQAEQLKRRARELEQFATDVHVQTTTSQLAQELDQAEKKIDIVEAALLISKLDNDELDVPAYVKHVQRAAADIERSLVEDASAEDRLNALNKHLFEQNGFHGSRTNYYHQANSHLDRVIDDREGLPITLSVLYMELARRLGLNVVGVGLPAHFVVRHEPEDGPAQLIDVFDGGKALSRDDADKLVRELTGQPLEEAHLEAYTKQQIIRRMLQNLIGVAQRKDDREAMLRYFEAVVAMAPDDIQSRGLRAVMRFQTGRRAAALSDIDWILEKQPEGIDLAQLREMREHFATANPR